MATNARMAKITTAAQIAATMMPVLLLLLLEVEPRDC
jgi:hypothetical protein